MFALVALEEIRVFHVCTCRGLSQVSHAVSPTLSLIMLAFLEIFLSISILFDLSISPSNPRILEMVSCMLDKPCTLPPLPAKQRQQPAGSLLVCSLSHAQAHSLALPLTHSPTNHTLSPHTPFHSLTQSLTRSLTYHTLSPHTPSPLKVQHEARPPQAHPPPRKGRERILC